MNELVTPACGQAHVNRPSIGARGVVMSRATAAGTPPPVLISCGRSAAERRLSAIAALHQPVPENGQLGALTGPSCRQCGGRWPCTTALVLGAWPGEESSCAERTAAGASAEAATQLLASRATQQALVFRPGIPSKWPLTCVDTASKQASSGSGVPAVVCVSRVDPSCTAVGVVA